MAMDGSVSSSNASEFRLSRRGFLEVNAKLAALAGFGAVLSAPQTAPAMMFQPSVTPAGPGGSWGDEQIFYNSDAMNCAGMRCVHKIHVRNGRILRIDTDDYGDPEDAYQCPQVRACVKGRSNKYYVYSPDRVKYPLERTGPRGSGQFKRVSWDYALNKVSTELKRIKDAYGPHAILFHPFAGAMGGVKYPALFHAVTIFNALGPVTITLSDTSVPGWVEAELGTEMLSLGQGIADFRQVGDFSNYVVYNAANPAATQFLCNNMFRLAKMKERLRERGVKVIGIDPKFTPTLSMVADEWVPIRPGTDAAMVAAMAYTVIQEGLVDNDILNRFTKGYESYEAYVLGTTRSEDPKVRQWADGVAKTPEWAEQITGIPAAKIREIALNFATKKPAAYMYGLGANRTAIGDAYLRAWLTFCFMTGNVGKPGNYASIAGGIPPMPLKYMGSFMPTTAAMLGGSTVLGILGMMNSLKTTVIPAPLIGPALNNPGMPMYANIPAPTIRGYYGVGNMAQKWAETALIQKGMQNPRIEFSCETDYILTPTAKNCDIVLPAVTTYEREDISSLLYAGAPGTIYMQKAIEPLWEAKEDLWICRELASRFGLGHIFDANPSFDMAMRNGINMARAMDKDHPTYEEMKSGKKALYKGKTMGGISLKAAYDQQINRGAPFGTPSGKFEIYSEYIERETNSPAHRNMTWVQNDFPGWRDMKVRIPAIPKYTPHWEGVGDPLTQKYPFQAINARSIRRTHTYHSNNRLIADVWGPEDAWVNARDAAAKGIKNGDMVEFFNDRARVHMRVFVTERVMPGVVILDHGKYNHIDENGIVQGGGGDALTRSEFTGSWGRGLLAALGGPAWNTMLVDFEKVADYTPDEDEWRMKYYPYSIDGEQQTVENTAGQFLQSQTWPMEKQEGKTAEANVQGYIAQGPVATQDQKQKE